MSTLLLDQENEAASIIERNGLISSKDETDDSDHFQPIQDLEKTIREYTSDLPLGKAIYLLLNIHGHVFDKAVISIKEATSPEILIKMSESPTIRAILSIEHYLNPDDIKTLFKHVFDPLKEKILKRQPSEPAMRLISYFIIHSIYKKQIQRFFAEELLESDRKTQLAIVLVLQFLYRQYIASSNNYQDIIPLFLPPLTRIIEGNSQTPTLLACSAYELASHYCQYALVHRVRDDRTNEGSASKIVELDAAYNSNHPIDQVVWQTIENLLTGIEKWHASKTQVEIITYEVLHTFLSFSKSCNSDKDATCDWHQILTYLTPKTILSEKPLALKKQKSILADENTSPMIHIILLALLQKGRWNEIYGLQHGTIVLSTDEEENKLLLTKDYEAMLKTSIPKTQSWIAQLSICLPDLFPMENIENEDLLQAVLDQVPDESTETMMRLLPLIMKRAEPSICYLLFHISQQDERAKFAYLLLTHLITHCKSNQIM
ncbi:MAG: hypothetical protein EXX96DRAFT_490804 [Benjaminiella poitrasii]|nr:MAG: hypothetical protein EXX96DRAFT_490804 [Benjaminiella poitrasii]